MTENTVNNDYCRDIVARFDHDRHLITLYALQDKRGALYALYAFNYEISRIRESVSDPMLGEIRLQWWHEAIDDIYDSKVRKHDVITPFASAISLYQLPKDRVMDVLEGRRQDLYDDRPENMVALDDYLSLTAGSLTCLAVRIAGQRDIDDLAHMLGIAWGYVGIIRAIPHHLSLKKSYMPQDLMKKHGADKFLNPDSSNVFQPIIKAVCREAEQKLDHIVQEKKRINADSRSIFLLSSLCRSYLKSIRKADYNPFKLEEKAGAFVRQWHLLTAALFNRI